MKIGLSLGIGLILIVALMQVFGLTGASPIITFAIAFGLIMIGLVIVLMLMGKRKKQ